MRSRMAGSRGAFPGQSIIRLHGRSHTNAEKCATCCRAAHMFAF